MDAQVLPTQLQIGTHVLPLPTSVVLPEGAIKLGIRPEYLLVADAQTPGALPMVLTQIQDVGTHSIATASHEGQVVKARFASQSEALRAGSVVWLQVLGAHTCFYKNEEIVA